MTHIGVAVEDLTPASKDVNLSLGNVCDPIVAKICNCKVKQHCLGQQRNSTACNCHKY